MDGFLLAESKASKNEVEAALNDARKLKFQNAKVTLLLGSSLLALTACGGGGAGGIFSSGLGSGGAVIGRLAMAGSIVKGPVANALIFQDLDGDGYTEGVDPFTFTDADGNYDMRFFPGSGQIVVLDQYYVDSTNRPISMNILGEPTGEQFQSDPDRFTLKKAIDLTTGSQPGSFTFDAPDGEVSDFVTTPVSTVDGEMTASIANALQDLPTLSNGETFTSYNPIQKASQAARNADSNGTNVLSNSD